MELKCILNACWIVLSAMLAGTGAQAAVITPQEVSGAITAAGLKIVPNQITLLNRATANSDNPRLLVGTMVLIGKHEMKVRMECADRRLCSPFFVMIHWQSGEADGMSDLGAEPPVERQFAANGSQSAVRAGSYLTLILEAEHIRIETPVIALESGNVGQVIRVTSKDHRQMYTAEIVDGSHLQGRLER